MFSVSLGWSTRQHIRSCGCSSIAGSSFSCLGVPFFGVSTGFGGLSSSSADPALTFILTRSPRCAPVLGVLSDGKGFAFPFGVSTCFCVWVVKEGNWILLCQTIDLQGLVQAMRLSISHDVTSLDGEQEIPLDIPGAES